MSGTPSLLLLAPSRGFGGGIERVASAIGEAWPGEVVRVDLYRREHTADQTGQPLVKLGFSARAIAAAIRHRPKVILSLHVGLLPVAHVAAALTGARTAVMGIGLEVWSPMRPRRRLSIRRCDRVLAISTFTARWMARRAEIPEERIAVVPLPIDATFAPDAGPERRDQASEPAFVTVSRIVSENRYKGHLDIVRALPAVLEQEPRARWIVIGDGSDLERLRDECERLGVAGATELRGAVDDGALADAYREARFHVLPSVADPEATPPTGEGFGLVYLEAALYGLPSIASRAGGGSLDFVEDERTGLLVEVDDEGALAAAIVRLLRDRQLTERLGEAARERALERHLPEHFRSALVAALG